jgi:hypothetical protein
MTLPPPWKDSEPPKDRPFLAFALPLDIPEKTEPLRIVAAWERPVEEWRPVRVSGDRITGTKLNIICWAELPDAPTCE